MLFISDIELRIDTNIFDNIIRDILRFKCH